MHRLSLHIAAIDVSAIRENTKLMVQRSSDGNTVADVRADGYGHGAVESARAAVAGGAVWLGVTTVSDGLCLRGAGITAPISILRDDLATPIPELSPTGQLTPGAVLPVSQLYGLARSSGIRPAMRVSAYVVGTKSIAGGEGVSYGYTYRAQRPTNLALVAIGYANGLDRFASNTGSLWLAGKVRRIAGRVAMNVAMVDLGSDTASVGDEAVVFGDPESGEPSLEQWATSLGKDAAEVASVLGTHLPRSYR